jgi:uncharacterized protein involved in outer membrane biogenesis
MRRFVLIVIGLIVAVMVLVGVAFGLVNSGAARARIANALSSALGQPVAIGSFKIGLLPIPALEAGDVRIGGADSNAAPGLALSKLRVLPELSSFLPGRTLTVNRVDLRGLTISLRKDKSGKWLLPVAPAPTGGGPSGPGVELRQLQVHEGRIRVVDDSLRTRSGGPTITTITDIEAELQAAGGALKVPSFTGKLGHTTVNGSAEAGPRGATLHLTSESIENADLPALFALAAMPPYPDLSISGKAPVELNTNIAPDFKTFVATGKASIDRVKFGTFVLDRMSSSFRFDKGVFTLDPFNFTFFGGKQQGTVAVDLNQPAPVYTIKSSLTGLDVNRALSATTSNKDFLFGTANLSTTVKGSGSSAPAIQKSLAGTAKFQLANGMIKNFPLLAAVNQALGITEGTGKDTKFESLSATATIGGGKAQSNDLLLKAGELTMTGAGVLGFDQSLNFKLNTIVSAAKSQQLLAKLGPLGRLRNEQGQLVIPVTVGGTTLAPKYGVDVGAVAKAQAKEQLQQGAQKGLMKLFQKFQPGAKDSSKP